MLPLSIVMLLFAGIVAGFTVFGGVGAGAMFFATGFLLIAMIAMLNVVRARTPTVF